jgi:hypothetical protein
VALSTLANSPNPHRLCVGIVGTFARPVCPKLVALATNQTISRHKSLSYALRKCARLNGQRRQGVSNETN